MIHSVLTEATSVRSHERYVFADEKRPVASFVCPLSLSPPFSLFLFLFLSQQHVFLLSSWLPETFYFMTRQEGRRCYRGLGSSMIYESYVKKKRKKKEREKKKKGN